MSPIAAIRVVKRRRAHVVGSDDERALVARLRDGDEEAFLMIVQRHNAVMQRFARSLVGDAAVAEEVVQDTWLGMLRGIDRFEGRSSLRVWLAVQARTPRRPETATARFRAGAGTRTAVHPGLRSG